MDLKSLTKAVAASLTGGQAEQIAHEEPMVMHPISRLKTHGYREHTSEAPKSMNWNYVWLTIIFTGVCTSIAASGPDPSEISRILGYPAAELIVTDVTDIERDIYTTPTFQEAESGIKPPMAPSRIISAFRITGKKPASFYPITITVVEEGAFLSSDFKKLLAQIATIPHADLVKQGVGYLGSLDCGENGTGGIILSELRVPSNVKEMRYPSSKMATISEIRIPKHRIDVRVAINAALDAGGNTALVKIPEGEIYYNYFRQPRGAFEDVLPDAPVVDWSGIFKSLNLVTLKAYIEDSATAKRKSMAIEPKKPAQSQGNQQIQSSSSEAMSEFLSKGWSTKALMLGILLVLGILLRVMLKRRS